MRRALTAVLALALALAVTGCAKAKADEGRFEDVSDTMHQAALKAEPEPEPREEEAEPEAEPEDEVYEEAYEGPVYEETDYYEPACYEPDYSGYNTDGPSHDMPGYYEGHVETYYSSNVLRHYRTDEWTPDDEGFYRDGDGYYIVGVGINDGHQLGDVIDTGKGKAVVSDFGTATNDVDFYTNW